MNEILHFGPGNFFRAHLADYTQELGSWLITGVSLRSSKVRDGLSQQGYVYTLDSQRAGIRRISVIDNIIVAGEQPKLTLDLVQNPRFPVISATVTEKGYNLNPKGHLDFSDPGISHDLSSVTPSTFIGILARGLASRTAPVTVLSCDNRHANGDALAQAVAEFQAAAGLKMGCKVSFPNAMVDRITPATSQETIEKTGDPMAVSCEPYKEWVIEDRFASTRPNWPGVHWVKDVSPYEMRKLRLLNGAHSYLAYAGALAGYDYVHEAIKEPKLRQTTRSLMEEASTTLPESIQSETRQYADALIARFDNKNVKHELRQIAMDGSQKIPYRLVDSIRSRKSRGLTSPALCAGIKAWTEFIAQETQDGRVLDDPQADALVRAVKSHVSEAAVLAVIGASDLVSLISE